MLMNKRKQRNFLYILIALTICLIWGQSAMSRMNSAEESGWVLQLVAPFLEIFLGKGNVTDHIVRKLAHFTEYFVLGAEMAALFFPKNVFQSGMAGKRIIKKGIYTVGAGLFIALVDETIQIFSHRGPQVADIWLDGSGVLTAVLLWTAARCLPDRRGSGFSNGMGI